MKSHSPGIYKKTINVLIVFSTLMFSCLSYGQSLEDSLINTWNNTKLPKTIRATAYNDYISAKYLEKQADSAFLLTKRLIEFTLKNDLNREYAYTLITLGNIEHHLGNHTAAINDFNKSLKLFQVLKDKKGEAISLNNIGKMYKSSYKLDEALEYYNKSLTIHKALKDTSNIAMNLINIGNVYNFRFKLDEALTFYQKSLELSIAINDKKNEALAYINLGHNYTMRKDFETAVKYLNNSRTIGEKIGNTFLEASALKNLAQSYYIQKDFDSVIKYSNLSLSLSEKISNKSLQRECYYFLYEGYKGKGNFESAINYMEKFKESEDGIQEVNFEKKLQNIQISKIRMKDSLLQAQKNYEANLNHELEIQEKNKEKHNLIILFITGLIIVLILVLLGYKNVKRKQLIIAQEKEIELQRKDKKLKELELQSIDAMILGQEKERQRLASELHDSVGASLSAVKLHFNYLIKEKNNIGQADELIKKISTLLEDTYVEVRSLAHLKNSGVMPENGLLPAIKKLSTNVSDKDNLQIEVQSHGLNQRLENSLEISIFRIIQELVTNIIKHAEASEAGIHITNHDDSLNIMVEDNGKGFNSSQITKTKKGMGISSIDKRIEQLNGTMSIESELNKGTSIIIDIPI